MGSSMNNVKLYSKINIIITMLLVLNYKVILKRMTIGPEDKPIKSSFKLSQIPKKKVIDISEVTKECLTLKEEKCLEGMVARLENVCQRLEDFVDGLEEEDSQEVSVDE